MLQVSLSICEPKPVQRPHPPVLVGAGGERTAIRAEAPPSPLVPPIQGREAQGCFVYRTIDDLEAIRAYAAQARVGVVIGGGLLGLEAANALNHMGLETHVVEFAPRLMAMQVDEGGGQILRAKIESLGVSVHTGKHTTEIGRASCRERV